MSLKAAASRPISSSAGDRHPGGAVAVAHPLGGAGQRVQRPDQPDAGEDGDADRSAAAPGRRPRRSGLVGGGEVEPVVDGAAARVGDEQQRGRGDVRRELFAATGADAGTDRPVVLLVVADRAADRVALARRLPVQVQSRSTCTAGRRAAPGRCSTRALSGRSALLSVGVRARQILARLAADGTAAGRCPGCRSAGGRWGCPRSVASICAAHRAGSWTASAALSRSCGAFLGREQERPDGARVDAVGAAAPLPAIRVRAVSTASASTVADASSATGRAGGRVRDRRAGRRWSGRSAGRARWASASTGLRRHPSQFGWVAAYAEQRVVDARVVGERLALLLPDRAGGGARRRARRSPRSSRGRPATASASSRSSRLRRSGTSPDTGCSSASL